MVETLDTDIDSVVIFRIHPTELVAYSTHANSEHKLNATPWWRKNSLLIITVILNRAKKHSCNRMVDTTAIALDCQQGRLVREQGTADSTILQHDSWVWKCHHHRHSLHQPGAVIKLVDELLDVSQKRLEELQNSRGLYCAPCILRSPHGSTRNIDQSVTYYLLCNNPHGSAWTDTESAHFTWTARKSAVRVWAWELGL